MIVALIIWSYLGVLLYLYGAGAARLLYRWLGEPQERLPGLPILLLFGLTVFGTLAAYLSIILPLGGLAAVLLAAGALLLFLAVRPPLPRMPARPTGAGWLTVGVVLLAFLVVWVSSTDAPSNPDTNLYHAQTIHWVES